MTLKLKQWIIGILGLMFLGSLIVVQYLEVVRRREESGMIPRHVIIPAESQECIKCHGDLTPAIIDHWKGSTHAVKGVGCVNCHKAEPGDADGFDHYGAFIATIVTPNDCAKCHPKEAQEFKKSHHSKGGQILASLDNFLAETVEGARMPFNPHAPTPGKMVDSVNGMASVAVGCSQCHGSKVALKGIDGSKITVDDLKPGPDGKPTNTALVAKIAKDSRTGTPLFHETTWPNAGIGRLNLDGSHGSCSACHSRHDFSPRRARQPENCAHCHLGPDHPQKEIYEESRHGIAFRDLMQHMHLDSKTWVLGKDYSQAPTCATCHMSGNSRNGGTVTHDPGERISWTNRPPISLVLDTDEHGKVVTETDPIKRAGLIKMSAETKRNNMKQVCSHCHSSSFVASFYKQYDDFVVLYNEKFAKPGAGLMKLLLEQKLRTKAEFDEPIEWTWYYLWHHEGRRGRHGASMMAPDYAHWHGMFEVAERFYRELIPEALEIAKEAEAHGKAAAGKLVRDYIDSLLSRPEHAWYRAEKLGAAPPRPTGPAGKTSAAKPFDPRNILRPPAGISPLADLPKASR